MPDGVPDLRRLRHIRATDPSQIRRLRAMRSRRSTLTSDGRLLLIAADHTARGSTAVRETPDVMADRADLLRRLVTALARPGVDGVLGTADIIDDLLLLGALEDKIAIGSMNRGGLDGAVFEFDDRFTGYDVPGIIDGRLDGGKMLCRIALDDPATAATLEACGSAVSRLAENDLMALVEPFLSRRVDGRVVHDFSAAGVARSIGVASGLGASSANTWLKLPVLDDLEVAMTATTLPTLLLGGDPTATADATYATWLQALRIPGVRGLVVGRALLYPRNGDVSRAVDVAAELVHSTSNVTGEFSR